MTLEQKRIKRKLMKVIDTEGHDGLARKIRDGVDLPVPTSLLTETSIEEEVQRFRDKQSSPSPVVNRTMNNFASSGSKMMIARMGRVDPCTRKTDDDSVILADSPRMRRSTKPDSSFNVARTRNMVDLFVNDSITLSSN